MSKSARKSRKTADLRTLSELAEALKSPISTVSGWIRHPWWKWNKKAPWKRAVVPDILNAAADNLERGRPPAEKTDPEGVETLKALREQKLRQEIRKLRAHADQAETALAKERGDLHDADACEEEAARRASLYRTAAQNLPSQVVSVALSAGLPHDGAPKLQRQVEDLVNACLRFTAASDAQPTTGDGAGDESLAAAGEVVTLGMV